MVASARSSRPKSSASRTNPAPERSRRRARPTARPQARPRRPAAPRGRAGAPPPAARAAPRAAGPHPGSRPGPYTWAASSNAVSTSHSTVRRHSPRPPAVRMASIAPAPPSTVALPPAATRMRLAPPRAPRRSARRFRLSSLARGRAPRGEQRSRCRRDLDDCVAPASPRRLDRASERSAAAPHDQPPSASTRIRTCPRRRRTPGRIRVAAEERDPSPHAAATSHAGNVPLNESGATRIRAASTAARQHLVDRRQRWLATGGGDRIARARTAIAVRVSVVAEPRWGTRTAFSSSAAWIHIGLAFEHIEAAPAIEPLSQRLGKRSLVDDRPAGRIDEERGRLHLTQRPRRSGDGSPR